MFRLVEEDYSKEQDRSMTKKVLRRGTGWTYPNTGGMVDSTYICSLL